MLKRLAKHPRITFCFYSSMMRKTIVPVMHELMNDNKGELEALKNQIGIFDREYCKEMMSLKCYDAIKEEKYDTYRDLQKIFSDDLVRSRKFSDKNTILIDSDSRKVQLWLDNALITEPYTKEDVALLPSASKNAVREDGSVAVRNQDW